MIRDFTIKLNKFLDKYMWAIAPLGCIIGVLLGDRIKAITFLGTYVFAILTFTGAVAMRFSDFKIIAENPKPVFVYLIFGRVLICLTTSLVVKLLLPSNITYFLGFLLYIMGPVAIVSFTWTNIYDGKGILSLTILMVDTLISPFFLPFVTKLLIGTSVAIDSLSIMKSLILMVVIPLLLGITANELSKNKIKTHYHIYFKPFGRFALLFALILNCSKVSNQIKTLSFKDLYLVLICMLVPVLNLYLGYLSSKLCRLNAKETVTLTYSSGLKNNTASLVIATTYFEPLTALPIMIIILFQQEVGAILGEILFKKKKQNLAPVVEAK